MLSPEKLLPVLNTAVDKFLNKPSDDSSESVKAFNELRKAYLDFISTQIFYWSPLPYGQIEHYVIMKYDTQMSFAKFVTPDNQVMLIPLRCMIFGADTYYYLPSVFIKGNYTLENMSFYFDDKEGWKARNTWLQSKSALHTVLDLRNANSAGKTNVFEGVIRSMLLLKDIPYLCKTERHKDLYIYRASVNFINDSDNRVIADLVPLFGSKNVYADFSMGTCGIVKIGNKIVLMQDIRNMVFDYFLTDNPSIVVEIKDNKAYEYEPKLNTGINNLATIQLLDRAIEPESKRNSVYYMHADACSLAQVP